jgi:cytochrome P450
LQAIGVRLRPGPARPPSPAPPPRVDRLRAFLETPELLDDATRVLSRHADRLGGAFYYYFGGVKKVLIATDPEIFRHIFKDNYENYFKSDIQIRRMGEFLGQGMLTSHGAPWRRKRRIIQHAFDADRLAAMADDMEATLARSLTGLEDRIAKGPVEVGAEMMRITFAMVTQSMFSTRLPDDEIKQISDGIVAIQAFMVRQIVQPYLRPWFAVTGQLRKHQRIRAAGDEILVRQIRARRADGRRCRDLLGILLEASEGEDGVPMSDRQVLIESMQILVAGHETSSNALTWILYLLSRNPESLRAARDECRAVLGDRPLRPGDLARLPVTTSIIDEALRLYPPFWMIDRMARKADRVGAVSIPAGSTVIAFIHGAQHAPDQWSAPESFKPERFIEEGRALRTGFRHLPFGAGPRRCIGANYAMMQMVMILNAVLRRYHFVLADHPPVRAQPMIVQRPRDGVWMHFEKRC